ncbi:MAG: 30S ribosomal protein S20 [Akkermansiaceae bacterium]|jgi:small subunit ribosomal protein S20|nr:30S ribosomal protein S20 [Luteolibacter sp.]
MANTKSAIKRNRQTATRTERNRAEKSRMKTVRKKTLAAIESGNKQEAVKASDKLASVLDKAAKRNLIHPNKAANIKSKTAKAIAAIG